MILILITKQNVKMFSFFQKRDSKFLISSKNERNWRASTFKYFYAKYAKYFFSEKRLNILNIRKMWKIFFLFFPRQEIRHFKNFTKFEKYFYSLFFLYKRLDI